ncbi:MAG: hypothetical protein L3J63_07755, partial [Geopsychrobacter sp.]|nr:hypothetical protein [Geopsychrobacter sp.]
LALLGDYAVLDLLFPQIDKLGLWDQLETMTERVLQLESDPCSHFYLEQTLEEDVSLRALLFFALLWLRVPSSANPASILARLHFSKRSQAILKALQEAPTVPEKIFNNVVPRILALQLETCGSYCVERLIFTLLMKKTANVDAKVESCLAAYMKYAQDGRIGHLLDGKRLLSLTDLTPGPKIGYWQQRIKDAEIAGEIWDEASAISWLQEQFYD